MALCRHVGILEVHVLEGRNMRKMDAIGKSDPWVEVYTQPSHKEKTVCVSFALVPDLPQLAHFG